MESNRQRKVAKVIEEDLAELFRRQAADAHHNILITVSGVRISPDLSIAKVYLSIYPPEHREEIMTEIEEGKASYRNYIGHKMAKQVRIIPELKFFLDTSFDDAERIDRELKGLGDNPVL